GEARQRLEACGADAALVQLALRCLAFQPLERPPNAAAVAEVVTAYRASVEQRLRAAELERAAAQAKAVEERKRRRVLLALAGVVLLAVSVAGGVWVWLERQRSDAEQHLLAALDSSALLQEQGKWPEALAATHQAEGLLPAAGDRPELRQRVRDRIAEVELGQRLEEIRTPET